MSAIKLVLTDFDGTVAQMGKHIVSEAVREAVIACEESGVRMVPVTGRYYEMARPVLEILGFEDLGLFDNGATIQNCKTGAIIWRKWMEPEIAKQVALICIPGAYDVDYTEEHIQHTPVDNELEIIESLNMPVPHVYALVDPSRVEQISKALDQIKGITYYTAPGANDKWPDAVGIQVNHKEADKYHGVNALRDILTIPIEETLAIGDGDNDVALFKNANLKIAMGNATDLLKARANHIVASVDDDGFVEAMNKYVLKK